MSTLRFSISVLLSLFLYPYASATETPELNQFREKALFNRVRHVVEFRQKALWVCTWKQKHASALIGFTTEIGAALKQPYSQSNLLELLSLFQRSETWSRPGLCQEEFERFDRMLWKQERRKFAGLKKTLEESLCLLGAIPNCKRAIDELVQTIDPHCAVEVVTDSEGRTESNPCLAGDTLTLNVFWQKKYVILDEIDGLLQGFYRGVSSAAAGSTLDYWTLSSAKDRKFLLSLLVFLTASTTSNGDWVDGFWDFVWRQPLRDGMTPADALEFYHGLKRRRDLFRDLLLWSNQKKLHFSMMGVIDLTGANHHDFMSAFLACHYSSRNKRFMAKAIPRVLGYGYESLDLAGHLKSGVALDVSVDNFKTDTKRHTKASNWGADFCSP